MKESGTVFLPELTTLDWFSLALLIALAIGLLALGVWGVLRSGASARRAAACATVAALSVGAVAALLYERSPILASVTFSDTEMVIRSPGSSARLPLSGSNSVEKSANSVRLISGSREVELPRLGSWRLDNLVVSADYLANEFWGRSLARRIDDSRDVKPEHAGDEEQHEDHSGSHDRLLSLER